VTLLGFLSNNWLITVVTIANIELESAQRGSALMQTGCAARMKLALIK
jgi:hypothetical protein